MRLPWCQYTTRTATCFVSSTKLCPVRRRQPWMGDQIRIPRVVITFFFFSPSFSKAILRRAELPSLCNVVFSYLSTFVSHFAMAVFSVLCVHTNINKQRDTSFEFSSILSTVDLSKHLITVESFENSYSSSIL